MAKVLVIRAQEGMDALKDMRETIQIGCGNTGIFDQRNLHEFLPRYDTHNTPWESRGMRSCCGMLNNRFQCGFLLDGRNYRG